MHWLSIRDVHLAANHGCEMCAMFVKELDRGGQHPPQQWDNLAVGVEISFASTSEGFDDRGKDTLGFYTGGDLMFLLEFCVDRGCAIPHLQDAVGGRTIQRESRSAECFALLDTWLRYCYLDHEHGVTDGLPATIPKRLVDITVGQEDDGVRVLHKEQLKSLPTFQSSGSSDQLPFAYLSYTWGDGKRDTSRYREALRNSTHVLSFSDLDGTLRDAVSILRHLKFNYVWVDVLCI